MPSIDEALGSLGELVILLS